MIVYDSAGQRLELGVALYEGGEGVIYAVIGRPYRLAKIYKPEKRSGKQAKLARMVANPPADPGSSTGHAAIAWPETLLYESGRRFMGYLMPKIADAKTLLHVLNPRLRARTLPDFDQNYLHRAARNLAAALFELHKRDYVIGDLNETNLLVTPAALVTVIDVDSFQVKEKQDGQITFYPCPVGRPEYTPPELQGRYFLNEVRHAEQDNFSLAVLIFQLLMDGNHPFRSIWLGRGDPPPVEEKIIQGWFPYTSEPRGPVKPPLGLTLERLHPPLAGLMRRCFIDGHESPRRRPSAAEWESALKAAEKALYAGPCGHAYAAHLERCPSCGALSPPLVVACPECGTLNPDMRAYCEQCAAHLHSLAACPHCGQLTAQAAQAKYCEACGRRLYFG
jgi:DNA-binding helix-hairpin-helix protein with protein kinase domain